MRYILFYTDFESDFSSVMNDLCRSLFNVKCLLISKNKIAVEFNPEKWIEMVTNRQYSNFIIENGIKRMVFNKEIFKNVIKNSEDLNVRILDFEYVDQISVDAKDDIEELIQNGNQIEIIDYLQEQQIRISDIIMAYKTGNMKISKNGLVNFDSSIQMPDRIQILLYFLTGELGCFV